MPALALIAPSRLHTHSRSPASGPKAVRLAMHWGQVWSGLCAAHTGQRIGKLQDLQSSNPRPHIAPTYLQRDGDKAKVACSGMHKGIHQIAGTAYSLSQGLPSKTGQHTACCEHGPANNHAFQDLQPHIPLPMGTAPFSLLEGAREGVNCGDLCTKEKSEGLT